MGGVISKEMILNDESIRSSLKGIIFIASPLKGSTMEDEINKDM